MVARGYTDYSFQIDHDDSSLLLGFAFHLNGGDAGWKSSKDEKIFNFTIKVGYIVVSNVVKKVVWIKKVISEYGLVPTT